MAPKEGEMGKNRTGVIHNFSEGGIAATHATLSEMPVFIAPTTADEHNHVTTGLFPIACWSISDLRFAFDSSVLRPEVAEEIAQLKSLRQQHRRQISSDAAPGNTGVSLFPPLCIFGHADPVGDDEYNKTLSGRRATSVYALLTRKVELWERLYSQPFGGDRWGGQAIDLMLQATGDSPDEQPSRKRQSIESTGARATLFQAYMDQIAGDLKLDSEDFLARGADAGGKGDYQGCGEFNPLFLFSQAEDEEFQKSKSKDDRNSENAPNRRVLALLFRPGSSIVAARWPCPRVSEGSPGCRKRFWSNGEDRRRRLLPEERRDFSDSADTFACRFYQRITSDSPCEAVNHANDILVRLCDAAKIPIANAPCRIISGGKLRANQADESGFVAVAPDSDDVQPVIEWTEPGKEDDAVFPFRRDVFIEIEDGDEAGRRRLTNLGYDIETELKDMVLLFQQDFSHAQTGVLADIQKELITWHDGGDPPPGGPVDDGQEPSRDPVSFDGPVTLPDDPDNPPSDGLTASS